jgi:SAM-dependent methyltransferase
MDILDSAFWDNRYLMDQTGWDIGQATPALRGYFEQLENKKLKILIPGCGNAYEAAYLMDNGFEDVTLIDISGVLVKELRRRFVQYEGKRLHIIQHDFFDYTGQFDLIIEQTFFCALNPALRKAYVSRMYELLKPGGKLVGLLFNREFEGGPPFSGSLTEYKELFKRKWDLLKLETCYNSIVPRAGTELFIIAQKYVE